MKHPLRSSRVALVTEDGREFRVDLDGLVKGQVVRCRLGEGGGWWWASKRAGLYGHAATKAEAVRCVIEGGR